MAKIINKNEFRKLNTKKGKFHPTYIFAQRGKKFEFLGITHAAITDGLENIPLEKNPEPGNNTQAYIRPSASEAHKSSFGKKLKGWAFGSSDKKKVEQAKKRSKK